MDYIDGIGLDKKMATGGMSAEDLVKVAARVAQGLVAAHDQNLVHRDLSPDNIILRNGRPEEAVIIDFGIAKDDNPGAETVVGNEFAGKYAYAAPEQLNGHSDLRTDIYALGALLLAVFRGKSPDIGENPVALLRLKELPLNVEGVPEPLKTLITKMTNPDPAQRFQSAEDVLRAIDPTYTSRHIVRTEVTPPTSSTTTAATPPGPKTGRRALVAVLVLGALAAGGYFSGALTPLFAPKLPTADPFTLIAENTGNGVISATGYAPNDMARAALIGLLGDGAVIELAQGAIAPSWGEDVLAVLIRVAALPEWRVAVADNSVTISGMTEDRAALAGITKDLAQTGSLQASIDLQLGPRFLTANTVLPVLAENADCGPLTLSDAPATGWGLGAKLIVTGRMAEQGSRVRLAEALSRVIGDRSALLDVEILNGNLCKIEQALPRAGSRGFGVIFGFGDREDPNPAARYFLGENPAIDVLIPAEVTTGYLWVSIVDVTGSVFHLLPNVNRPDNQIATLRAGQDGAVLLRVAFGIEEAKGTTKMAFIVDNSVLGKSKVVVLHSEDPVFESLRPISESTDSFAAALASQEEGAGMAEFFSIDARILTTEAK
jgi:serine/threonine-protein kinase